ncbi:sulfate permease [Gilvimarinus agarilyticus]|uniref:SulP family inorganic anion transporter n=1 Tax=Gilvimarinus sp. 2_MG-2023 TaxID=3062666 RepID=UPI001C09DBD5|nr:sulfate permease [Gilvimarinus sp. 2_MG-2023]MBU2885578.1 sulfate permease [Gilvimarinus agarilyticus]MDO6570445.1 sulfate permease [Gilvimarinus sp. 2_MG-2023]
MGGLLQTIGHYLPILDWSRTYTKATLMDDMLAASIVTVMLIPQSLAYALLAGLPPEVGLYASLLPLLCYGLLGTSRTMAVGPVAVVSLMTAAAVGGLGLASLEQKLAAAAVLALASGGFLLLLGLLKLGFLANFLSHPVIAGFITASGILIALSQVKHLLGASVAGDTLPELLEGLWLARNQINLATLLLGSATLLFLFWVRAALAPLLQKWGLSARSAAILAKTGPVVAVVAGVVCARWFDLASQGVALVGEVPARLPALSWPQLDWALWQQLAVPAILIAVIGFVESVSVAQTLAAKRRQRIDPDQELMALGAANISAGLSQGFPVTGGFSRSVVNFDAGAQTPAAGIFTALGMALAVLFLTPALYFLPKATLAATIVVAVLSLVDLSILGRAWRFSRADFLAVASTIVITLLAGVEWGVSVGVLSSIGVYLIKASRPHLAVVGQVPGTEHYRNVERHQVITQPHVLSIRVDESLFFANARFLEEQIYRKVADNQQIRHVILQCNAVNAVDLSALESLEAINQRLADGGIKLHLSEVKGPVMDRLQRSHFLTALTGNVYLSHHQAVAALDEEDFVI